MWCDVVWCTIKAFDEFHDFGLEGDILCFEDDENGLEDAFFDHFLLMSCCQAQGKTRRDTRQDKTRRDEMSVGGQCSESWRVGKAVMCGIVLYCVVLYCIVLCCIVLYCIVLWRTVKVHEAVEGLEADLFEGGEGDEANEMGQQPRLDHFLLVSSHRKELFQAFQEVEL